MKCPFCGFADTQVKDSRTTDDNTCIRRRRECPECGSRFTTFERVQLRELIVVKKNGDKTMFDRDKLARSIELAVRKRPVNPGTGGEGCQLHSAASGKLRGNRNSVAGYRRVCDGGPFQTRSYRLYSFCVSI